MAKNRLIIVPQMRIHLRYQGWWREALLRGYSDYFDEILVLGHSNICDPQKDGAGFSSLSLALQYELEQMQEYLVINLRDSDVLLLCDLSFPGLFASVLSHKRPSKCFAICHATSKNRYDVFAPIRRSKYGMERSSAKLFDGIFVASTYHANKLGWPNLSIVPLPPPYLVCSLKEKERRDFNGRGILLASVSRSLRQKTNRRLEREIELELGSPIQRPSVSNWRDYYKFLNHVKFLVITSNEETYGYQVIDALMCGATPIAPRRFSYPEILPDKYLYKYGSCDDFVRVVRNITDIPLSASVPGGTFFQYTSGVMKGNYV